MTALVAICRNTKFRGCTPSSPTIASALFAKVRITRTKDSGLTLTLLRLVLFARRCTSLHRTPFPDCHLSLSASYLQSFGHFADARKYNTASPEKGAMNDWLLSGTVIDPVAPTRFVAGLNHSNSYVPADKRKVRALEETARPRSRPVPGAWEPSRPLPVPCTVLQQ